MSKISGTVTIIRCDIYFYFDKVVPIIKGHTKTEKYEFPSILGFSKFSNVGRVVCKFVIEVVKNGKQYRIENPTILYNMNLFHYLLSTYCGLL